jgi:hypothetical protein
MMARSCAGVVRDGNELRADLRTRAERRTVGRGYRDEITLGRSDTSNPGATIATRTLRRARRASISSHSEPESVCPSYSPVPHAKSENVRPARRLTIEATVNL